MMKNSISRICNLVYLSNAFSVNILHMTHAMSNISYSFNKLNEKFINTTTNNKKTAVILDEAQHEFSDF